MIRPPALQKGNTVAIISTARKITPKELQPAVDQLTSWGLNVKFGPNLLEEFHQFAGTDQQRAADLQWAMDHEEIHAVLCARGGYGTVRIIDLVDFNNFMQRPKWLLGYSDVTTLHNHVHTNCGVETCHSTMPINFAGNSAEAMDSLRRVIFNESLSYATSTHEFNRTGIASGQVIGGNLSIIYSLTGSNSDIDTAGKILFIEDLDEYLYHVDRMLQNLKKAGKLHQLAGLVVGAMTDMNDNTIPFGQTSEEIIRDAVAEYNFPVCYGFPVGHIDDNRAMIVGRTAEFSVTKSGATLRFEA